MLMAASVAAPLSAQQPAEVFTTLAAPTTAQATADQRAEAMPALAIMPADCDFCFTFTNLPGFIDSMYKANFIDEEDYADIPGEIRAIHSVALAGGKGSAATVEALISIYSAYKADELLDVVEDITRSASKDYKATLQAALKQFNHANQAEMSAALAAAKIAPVYGVLLATPGYEGVIAEWYHELTSEFENDPEDGIETVSVDGYTGIKIRMPEIEAKPRPYDSATDIAIKQELVKRTIYLLFKLEGDKIISVVCEDPADINTAATAQESLLGTDKLAKADAKLTQGLHCAFYGAPGVVKGVNSMDSQAFIKAAQGVGTMISALAEKHGAEQPAFTKAAVGMQSIVQGMQQLFAYPIDSPVVGTYSWSGSKMDIDYYHDNCGITYKPGKLALSQRATDPNTIMYAESAYYTGFNFPSLSAMLTAGIDVADGIVAALPERERTESAMQIQMVKEYLPLATEAIDALCTTASGLDNTAAIVIDNKATMPALLGGNSAKPTAFPRFAFYSGVSDRAKLSEGWDALLNVAAKAASKVGADPAMVNMLPIAKRNVGKAVSYSLSLPWFTDNMVPNLTLSDTAFVVGSSTVLNAELAETAAPTVDFSGTVCTIRFAPMASLLRSIAENMKERAKAEAAEAGDSNYRKATVVPVIVEDDEEYDEEDEYIDEEDSVDEMKEPVAVSVVTEEEDSEDFDEDADYADEEDYDEEDNYSYTYYEPSPAERRAAMFDNIAEAAEDLAEYVDSFHFTATTDDNTINIRLRVNLK